MSKLSFDEVLFLCFYAGCLTPFDVSKLNCCSKELARTCSTWIWSAYPHFIEIDLSSKSAVKWLSANISQIKKLRVRRVETAIGMLRALLAADGGNLAALAVADPRVRSLPPLPDSLTTLNLSVTGLARLPQLPTGLLGLDLTGCRSLELLPASLPKSLTSLNLSGAASLIRLPEQLPAGLRDLDVSGCSLLVELPHLPPGLRSLNCSSCWSLAGLPFLPSGLERLDCSRCASLSALPPLLPGALKHLACSGCRSLRCLPDMSGTQLRSLHCIGCGALAEQLSLEQLPATLIPFSTLGLPRRLWQQVFDRFFGEIDEMLQAIALPAAAAVA